MPFYVRTSIAWVLIVISALLATTVAPPALAGSAPAGLNTPAFPVAKAKKNAKKKRKARRRKRATGRKPPHARGGKKPPRNGGSRPTPGAAQAPPVTQPGTGIKSSPSNDTAPASTNPGTPSIGPNDVVTPMPVGLPVFAPHSFWNEPLPADASHPGTLVDALAAEVDNEMAARTGPWINTDRYGVPVYTVGSDVPRVHVTMDVWAPGLQADFESVPIPAEAQPAGGDDRHLTIYQPSTDTLWEMWLASRESDGWHARWGGKMTGVSTNPGYFPSPYGATATSLPLIGGLITIEQLKKGEIDHALAIAVPNTAAGDYTWPAQREDGKVSQPEGIPEGTRFRIDPDLDLSTLHLSRTGLVIARAAQRYGIVVRDTSGCVTFYGEDPVASWNIWPWLFEWQYPNDVLGNFPWHSLQVVGPPAPG